MRSRRYITVNFALALCALVVSTASAQRVAIVTPNGTDLDKVIASQLARDLTAEKLQIQDADMTGAAYSAVRSAAPFNMSGDEARRIGSVLGCDHFILVNTGVQRRARLGDSDQFEAYAATYLVASRTGLLTSWKLINSFADTEERSRIGLAKNVEASARELADQIQTIAKTLPVASAATQVDIPFIDMPGILNYRSPVPYKRLKPEYTRLAYLYDVTATIEATIDLAKTGEIRNIEITRWAGYGLDESVVTAIRSMNWRPGERDGKPLAVRFLVRYNFKKIEKDP